MFKRSLVILLILLLSDLCYFAQTYPSAITTILKGPRTLFFDEYTDPFQPKIQTTIYFTDFTEMSWTFSLRLKITGPQGIILQTKKNARPPVPIVVSPGQPYMLEGADLSFYFNYDNLDFTGITRAQLEVNNRLPEGLYTFCFEAIDYESARALSLPGCATAYLSLNDPPIIMSPVKASVIENISMQNILFQWQISNSTGNLNPNNLSYVINLYEVNNNWSNPQNALINQQALPIWESQPITNTTFIYSISEPMLEKGKRYVFTVKAIESSGRCSFKNEGYSTPCFFHYGYYENDTIPLITPANNFQFALSTPSQFKWRRPAKSLSSQLISYTLRLVEVNENQDPEDAIIENLAFYQQEYLPSSYSLIDKTIPVMFWMNVKRMGHYAWQVTGKSGTQEVAKSIVRTFTGPPAIESFIAGGFLMTVTNLTAFDTVNHYASGKCKTALRSDASAEFSFDHIRLSGIGNNEWVMAEGEINDVISIAAYTLQPDSFDSNKEAFFHADSIHVTTGGLNLSGKNEWVLPHSGLSGQREVIFTNRCKMTLANSTFYLNTHQPVLLSKKYEIDLLDPYGFVLKINSSSSFNVYQSKYDFQFNGFIRTPQNVVNLSAAPAQISFTRAPQLHYITQHNNHSSEEIRLTQKTTIGVLPLNYIVDLSEEVSPGKLLGDSLWKGIYIEKALLNLPKKAETSAQITLPLAKSFTFQNTPTDTNAAYIGFKGLTLKTLVPFNTSDSLKFNTFPSKLGFLFADIAHSEIKRSFIEGGIFIPVVDTLVSFPYHIEISDFGFQEGYLVNGLAGKSFTFNATGSPEQRISILIKRAVFRNNNRLEMDLNMHWPHFDLSLNGVQRFMAWGNGNIGFDVPNGKYALPYQSAGTASNFDITVDNLGCGRNGNVYAIGLSAKINMDEEISGENGPPVMNAYSMYKNPLLHGQIYIPPANTNSTTSTTTTSSYASSTTGYTQAVLGGLYESLDQLGAVKSDTSNFAGVAEEELPLVTGNTVVQIKTLVELIYQLKPFIKKERISERDWRILDRFKKALESDVVMQGQTTNAKGILNFVLNKAVESLVGELNGSIQNLSDKAMSKLRKGINGKIVDPINNRIDKSIGSVFTKLEEKVIAQVDAQYHTMVKDAFLIVKTNTSKGITNSVASSFEANITGKITGFVQVGVTTKVKNFVAHEISTIANEMIVNGRKADIDVNTLLQNSGSLLQGIADTVKDVILNANAANFINTAESLVDDAISGIDWNAIGQQILNDLVMKGVSQTIAQSVSQLVGTSAGPYVGAVLNNVKFDFSNLGEKLQNGEFDKIVKFDPTSIYLQTPAADIRGTLKFTKDDPVFGDSWQSDVLIRVKVPNKENPIEITAFFLNGKTTQEVENFTYWFAKMSVSGFTIPLNPTPVVWYGVEGFAYSKMQRTSPTAVRPLITNKFGIGAKFFFYDQPSGGKTYLFDLGAEAEFNDGGFYVQLVGSASVFNFQKTNGKYQAPGFVTGTGSLGFYKTPECQKIAGNFSVKLNTQPVICAGGDVGLDLRSPNDWKVWAGTQQNPIGVKILCKDFLSNTAYMQASNSGFTTGLSMNVALAAQSPWIELSAIKVRGYATMNFGYNAFASVEWDPTFKINEASISAWASASIGVEYQTAAGSNNLTLAGISLAGTLTYKSTPESELHGSMSGNITVANYSIGFETPVHYSLSKQEILN